MRSNFHSEWVIKMARKDEVVPDLPLSDRVPSTSKQYTRTAWLVMSAGLVATVGMISVSKIFKKFFRNNDESVVFFMGLLIGVVFSGWAILLALRAIQHGEEKNSPTALLWIASAVLIALVSVALSAIY
jgi:hypothetical protein